VELDAIIGIVALTLALSLLTFLTFWSRRTIDRIARKHLASLREVIKDMGRERR
jgi:hypothetical protein